MNAPSIVDYQPAEDEAPERLVYTFGGHEALVQIEPGAVVRTWTRDCFAGRLTQADQIGSQVCDPRYLNPQTGPFHVRGASPGDTLAVHFISIEPRYSWGVSATLPYFGSLTATPQTSMLHDALPERTWLYQLDVADRMVHFVARDSGLHLPLPMDPMHGTVGVAPPLGEVRSALTPGDWGGNLDTPEMRSGTTCYLGVNVEGALMSLGDGHALQGEGESCGVAVECAMNTEFCVDVIADLPLAWPRLESDDYIVTTGSTRPLEDAFRIAHTQMVHWIAELLDLSMLDSYQLITQIAETPIANVVDSNYTVTCKIRKDLIGRPVVMGGMHEALRKKAAAHTR